MGKLLGLQLQGSAETGTKAKVRPAGCGVYKTGKEA